MNHTWTCYDCPAWAKTYWPDAATAEAQARQAASTHRAECPGAGRLLIVNNPNPETWGMEHMTGNYDQNQPVRVPRGALMVAAAALGVLSKRVASGATFDFSDSHMFQLWAGPIMVADPLPDDPQPTTIEELAELLGNVSQTLRKALQNEWPPL